VITVGVVTKPQPELARPTLEKLLSWLDGAGHPAVLDPASSQIMAASNNRPVAERSEMPERCDLIVVLGGDGTLLSVARHVHRRDVPILGVNLGHLGFLTEVTVDQMTTALKAFDDGKAVIQRRMMLVASLVRNGETVEVFHCLNDAVVTKAALARITHFRVEAGGRWLTDMRADGLIVATPTGSTAYNLAAGGPIIVPGLNALILSPLCPHTLTMRPIILDANEPVSITLLADSEKVYLTADGQMGQPLQVGDRVIVERSSQSVALVGLPDRDYFSLLREKLGWGSR
jgi:NAD+ kinase